MTRAKGLGLWLGLRIGLGFGIGLGLRSVFTFKTVFAVGPNLM